MSYSRTYGRDTSTHSSTNISLQKEREREKKRREQQLSKQEENVDELFSQPRKVSTSRQDSLTRNLNNVLGDPNFIAEHLFRGETNIWLGTSRSGNQGLPTPAPPTQNQDASPRSYHNSNQHRPSSSMNRSFTSSQKRESSNSVHSQSSRPGSTSMSSSSSTHKSTGYDKKIRDDRSHQNNSQIKSNQLGFNPGHGLTQSNPVYARNLKEKQEAQMQSTKTETSFTSSHLPIGQKNSNSFSMDSTDSLPGLKIDIPARISDRDRVSSVDSDMLGGVENIFEDMIPLERPIGKLADAKTPGTGETKFNFNTKITQKKKPVGPESSVESSNADGAEANASDSESSDDDSSDDEEPEEGESNSSVWNLGNYYNNNDSEKSQSSVNEKEKNDRKTSPDRGSSKTEIISRQQLMEQGNSATKSSPRNQSSNYSVAHDSAVSRGRRADKKQSSRNSQAHPRSSSSSSQRSASSSQRSTSSGRRSASSHHRTTSNQIRDLKTNLNQTEPIGRWSSSKLSDSQKKKSDKAEAQHKNLSSSRGGCDRSISNSPIKSNSNYHSPRSMTQVKSEPSIKTNPPSTVKRSPGDHPSTNVFKSSGVKKETLSTTKTAKDVKPRHSVGRKGPSGRIAVKGVIDHRSDSKDVTRAPKSAGLTGLSDSSFSESSDDENDVTVKNVTPSQHTSAKQSFVGSDLDSSSDSDSDSSSSSDSESENEVEKVSHDELSRPAPVSWALEDLTPKQEHILKKSPSFKNEMRVSPRPVLNKSSFSPKPETKKTNNPSTVKPEDKPRPKQKAKKSSRKSAPGSLTPNTRVSKPVSDAEGIAGKTINKNSSSGYQSSTSNTWSKNRSQHSTADSSHLSQKSKSRTMSSSSDKVGRKHTSPCAGHSGQDNNQRTPPYKSFSAKNKFEENVKNEYDLYAPLLVRITSSVLKREALSTNINSTTDYGHHQKYNPERPRSLESPSKRSKSTLPSKTYSQHLTTVSTGSETDQPIRRADSVQVAVADGSTDWTTNGSGSTVKRKMNSNDHSFEDNHSQACSSKRRKRDKSSSRQSSPGSNALSPWTAENSHDKKTSPGDNWREPARETSEQSSNNHQSNRHNSSSREPYLSNRNSRNQTRQESPSSINTQCQHGGRQPATNGIDVVLPDSSVPEQERIQTSDWYMREGRRVKRHGGDVLLDVNTGRTRPGGALNRALAYFEAGLYFIMGGYVMEVENNTERLETGSNSGSSSTSHSPVYMYQQIISFFNYILKMRPHIEQEDKVFKRIMISCIRCQSILYYRVFKLNKERAIKYSEILTDQFTTKSKPNSTSNPSPRHHPANVAPNVVSPMSPAVPSPLCHPGPSPVNSINGAEQVSSSTQPGKMTPPSQGNVVFSQKTYDTYRQHHTIMCNLLHAHEKWDQGESMLEGHTDFFRNIDALCNRTLTFHTSLRDIFLYHKVVLHQLRALTTNSPRE